MIRIFLVLILLISTATSLSAQFEPTSAECDMIVKRIENTAGIPDRILSKGEIRINDMNTGELFQIVMMRQEEDYSFIFRGLQDQCFDNDTEVTFFFRNGTAIKFKSHNRDNCDGLVLVNMGGIYKNSEKYDSFLNQYIIGIAFESKSKQLYRLKLETPNNELMREVFECLIVAYEK